MKTYEECRKKYKEFIYRDYHVEKCDDTLKLTYDFEISGLSEFHPEVTIDLSNLKVINDYKSVTGRKLAFYYGMVELVSYWKIACPEQVIVKCGYLDENAVDWWKKLYFGGLGEFFYRNGVTPDFDSFMNIETEEKYKDMFNDNCSCDFVSSGMNIIPVGGGKDSDVTMELLKDYKNRSLTFTVNNQKARSDAAEIAGYTEDMRLKTYRKLDKNMLELNKQGFLNGHTPFSAIVAFLSAYCAFLIGADYIILSNESSANESNIEGTNINHQYSKSFEFEKDFTSYLETYGNIPVKYFSLLRPFNELQIAKQFSAFRKYHPVFRSCNVGSKQNIWCCNCAKCLFVYIILSPFLSEEDLIGIFKENLLNRDDLKDIFDGLVGFSSVKPFECIGTLSEINGALKATAKRYNQCGKKLPSLLAYYMDKTNSENSEFDYLLNEINNETNVPEKFMPVIKEMYQYVSSK